MIATFAVGQNGLSEMSHVDRETLMLDFAFKVWGIGILFIVLANAWGQVQFLASLRYRHSAVWRRLGRPTVTMLSSEPQAISRLLGYVASAEYRNLADTKMNLYGATLRYSVVALFVWFASDIAFFTLYAERGQVSG